MPMDLNDKKHNIAKNKKFINSVEFAISGIKRAYRDERNMRSHTISGILVILLGLVLGLERYEWLWILLCIFLVVIMEMLNTVFENIVDMVTDKHFHPLGKKIKDIAAGAVLITTFFAVIVGLLIFVPKIYYLLLG